MKRRGRRRKQYHPQGEALELMELLYTGGPRDRAPWPEKVRAELVRENLAVECEVDGREAIQATMEGLYYMGAEHEDLDELDAREEAAERVAEIEEDEEELDDGLY